MLKMSGKIEPADNEAREFVNLGVCAIHLAASIAAKRYNLQLENGRVSHSDDIAVVVQEHGYLALAMTLVRNPPAFHAKQQYHTQIKKITSMLEKFNQN